MGVELPQVPPGSGQHPISLVVLTANNLSASAAFYSKLFGWQLQPMSPELTAFVAPGGPAGSLRSNVPAAFPGMVPYIGVSDVDAMLSRVVAAGAAIEKPAWSVPGVGKLARFKEVGGTIYGLAGAMTPLPMPRMPIPFGTNPKPPAGSICSLEMYAADRSKAAGFFGELFGWGTLESMPGYTMFDPGAGISGVLQSHTASLPAVAYIYVTDVGSKFKEIEAAGGKRLGDPMHMPGMATFGYFTDPSGTSVGLIGP
jgi:predicted enzyme related to lactoylglutathione lyase